MSFILDALKKSEIERQRQSVPGLIDATVVRRRSRLPIWAVVLGLLLGVNLLVLTFTLTRKSTPGAQAPRPAAAGSAPAVDAESLPKPFSPLDGAPVYAPEIPITPLDNPVALPSTATRAASTAGTDTPAGRRTHRADPLLTDHEANAQIEEVLPSMSEISLSGSQALPELHLDVHVYSTKPSERFVYINMRKYHEGGTLQEGPAVERIRRDGVVLNHKGLRFILSRQP
jgi:general secretion pathway protein B